jgi:phosphomethylpyrimidine synthase
MRISHELKEYAERGMRDKSAEFLAAGGRIYLPLAESEAASGPRVG